MDGSGEHYAKWNKPGGERQIPYDLTYKWKLINKTNKQAKYFQRHWNKEQTEKGEEEGNDMGTEGKGHKWTCIKDPWTKPKGGRIEGRRWEWVGRGKWWWENGGYCTWTLILKNQKKKKKKEKEPVINSFSQVKK